MNAVKWHRILALGLLTALPVAVVAAEDLTKECFPIFDGMLFSGKPDLSSAGIKSIAVIDVSKWTKHTDDPAGLPMESTIADSLRSRPGELKLIALDLEYLPVTGAYDTVMQSVDAFSSILSRTKSSAPDSAIGYYGVLPVRDYWRAVKSQDSSEYKSWQSEGDRWRALAEKVDVLFPSLYTFYDDPEGWVRYATANLNEAKRVSGGKPVYAFIWPQYHDSNKKLQYDFIPESFWSLQLETVAKLADGVVIWGGYQREWSPDAPWWRATQSFMASHSCRKPLAPTDLSVSPVS